MGSSSRLHTGVILLHFWINDKYFAVLLLHCEKNFDKRKSGPYFTKILLCLSSSPLSFREMGNRQCEQMIDWKVAQLAKSRQNSFSKTFCFSHFPIKSPNICGIFERKLVAKNFKKSPNLVTLISGLGTENNNSFSEWKCKIRKTIFREKNWKMFFDSLTKKRVEDWA